MGRIFTFQQIQANDVPKIEDFLMFERTIREVLDEAPGVIGALIHGSVLRRDHSIRSDIDVVLVYQPDTGNLVVSLQQALQETARFRSIPLRLIAVDADLAEQGDHDLSPMYLDHLGRATTQGGIIKENPIPYIKPQTITFRQDLRNYLVAKCDAFNHALERLRVMSQEERIRVIGKALSFPIYVARKMLQFANPLALENVGDGKALVLTLYPSLGIERGSEILDQMWQLNQVYDYALQEQRAEPDERTYLGVLKYLEFAIWLSWEFARVNLVALRMLQEG